MFKTICLFCLGALCAMPAVCSASQVRFGTNLGSFDVRLFPDDAPDTVAFFLDFVARGDYMNTLVHRSIPDFVIQGGGFYPDGSEVKVPNDVPLELNRSHVRGTLAMARTAITMGSTDSSQWFINTVDNPFLDDQFGGYTIIGEVLPPGMAIVDAIASLPTVTGFSLNSQFSNLPVFDDSLLPPGLLAPSNLVVVESITVVPEPEFGTRCVLLFSAIAWLARRS
ncbi:MAG: peptidylprolyl isomerase [Planctomycetota bacterium]